MPDETSHLISDYEDSSSSNDETETEFKGMFIFERFNTSWTNDTNLNLDFETDCKSHPILHSDNAMNAQPSGSLYPELELKKMSLSMASSSTSTLLDGYMSSCSNEGAVALDPAAECSIQIERERAPYSVPVEGSIFFVTSLFF